MISMLLYFLVLFFVGHLVRSKTSIRLLAMRHLLHQTFGSCQNVLDNWSYLVLSKTSLEAFGPCQKVLDIRSMSKIKCLMNVLGRTNALRGIEYMAICKTGRETLPLTNTDGTLILNFQHPEPRENKFQLLKPSSLWYSIMVARAV